MSLAPLKLHLISFNRVGTDGYNVFFANSEMSAEQRLALDEFVKTLTIEPPEDLNGLLD